MSAFLRKVLLCYVLFSLSASLLISVSSHTNNRRLLEVEGEENKPPKKKTTNLSFKNQTKLIKSNLSTKNQTKLVKSSFSSLSKNQTKFGKSSNSTKSLPSNFDLKKLNSTKQIKKLNSTSKSPNLLKPASPMNKTAKPQVIKTPKLNDPETKTKEKNQKAEKSTTTQKPKQPNWLDNEEENDLVTEFRDLPLKFQKTLLPDLERISITSQKYITKANKQITRGFKPYIGNKYASTVASVASFAFIILPLLLVSMIINRFKAYFSLQKVIIFIQVYLSIYFSILCLSSLVTGLEPLRFFYATSESTYVCVMVLQTLCYVLYLLLLLMYLVLVFSTECGLGLRFLGLVQTFVGFGVGLHCYVAVFHRVVLHQPPKTNWEVHGIYATCFLVICLVANAERRKKTYLEEGGEEGKKN